ncbi:DUF3800 domain-containing protein [Haloarculaceae archaeon H-GB11]|nr:DUF3800 domain-containing protein [Haloarculaceae archaeon H-GB11]
MDYFGDESGHLKGVIQGDCEICVLAVVGGDRMSCGRCPKQAVRRVDDIAEAKWNDLLDKQKRRLFECFADNDHLEFGYGIFHRDQLKSLPNSHLLFQDVTLPPAWDLALAGYAYGEILFEMDADKERRATFAFDRISSAKQSEAVEKHLSRFVPDVKSDYVGSRQEHGVQAADCLAGAVAEDWKYGTDWLDYLDGNIVTRANHAALAQLQHDLTQYETGP